MTTLSAGAAAGLLVALMVVYTSDSRGAEFEAATQLDSSITVTTATRTVYQLGSARGIGKLGSDAARSARI